VIGGFEAEYLKLPEDVGHGDAGPQKNFAVESGDGLAPHFLAVLNIEVGRRRARKHCARQRACVRHIQGCAILLDFDQRIPLVIARGEAEECDFPEELGGY